MVNSHAKLTFVSLVIVLLHLSLFACNDGTPTPKILDEIDQIQVQQTDADAIQTSPGTEETEEFRLPNCGGSSELERSLGTEASVTKNVSLGATITVAGGVEVGISPVAKARLEAAVEAAYQQVYENVTSRLDTIVMRAAKESCVIYVVQWEEQQFASNITFNSDNTPYETSYAYVISVPRISDSYQESCPTSPLTPPPIIDETTNPSEPSITSNIEITDIFYDGEGSSEPDEYVEIRNNDTNSIQIQGWTLSDETNHTFTFPNFEMTPGQVCRIYTDQNHPESCGFNYGRGSAIWNNEGGDTATLKDANGNVVDTYAYQ